MRFGRCLCQEDGSGSRRYNLTLIADEGESMPKPSGFQLVNQPKLDRTSEVAVATSRALNVLLDALQLQGALSQEAIAKVKAAATPQQLAPGSLAALSGHRPGSLRLSQSGWHRVPQAVPVGREALRVRLRHRTPPQCPDSSPGTRTCGYPVTYQRADLKVLHLGAGWTARQEQQNMGS